MAPSPQIQDIRVYEMLFLDIGIYSVFYCNFSRHPPQPPLLPKQVQQDRQQGWEAEEPHRALLVSTVVPDTRGSVEPTLLNLMFR